MDKFNLMNKELIKDIQPEKDGEKVTLGGWVESIRDIGKIKFYLLRDITGLIQITLLKNAEEQVKESFKHIKRNSVVILEGLVKKNKIAPGGVEILPTTIEILNSPIESIPLDPKQPADLSVRLDFRPIDLRNKNNWAIFRIQSKIVEGMTNFLLDNEFVQVFTPCIMGIPSESGAEVFPIFYFQKNAFLRQDPQLHRQLTVLGGLWRIFDIGPSWRAEPSYTPRHLTEHRGCAVEFAPIKDESSTMRLEELLVVNAYKQVIKDCSEELEILEIKLEVPTIPFPEIRFPKVYEILKEFGKTIKFGEDIDRESEKILSDYITEKFKHDFVFLNRFPSKVKPFYVMYVDEDPKWARSVDLICKGLELSSGGQREHRYEKIITQLKEKNMSLEDSEWFTKFFKYGAPPHGGFNIGIERITMQMLNLKNIREVTLFPRDPTRLVP